MHSWTKEEQFLQHAAAPIQFTDRALTLPDFLPQPARHRIRRRRAVVAGGAQSALCGCGVFEITQNRTYGGRLETGAIDPKETSACAVTLARAPLSHSRGHRA
jgi:hypothetical protein